jgi:hypothetical protein
MCFIFNILSACSAKLKIHNQAQTLKKLYVLVLNTANHKAWIVQKNSATNISCLCPFTKLFNLKRPDLRNKVRMRRIFLFLTFEYLNFRPFQVMKGLTWTYLTYRIQRPNSWTLIGRKVLRVFLLSIQSSLLTDFTPPPPPPRAKKI